MDRVIRFLGILPLLVLSSSSTLRLQIPEAEEIPNWPAPAFWTPPAAKALGRARIEAVSSASAPLPFIAVPPCRIVDTRGNGFVGAYGPPSLSAGSPRNFTLAGQCGIPAMAGAVSLNVTVTNTQGPGFILIYPQGGSQPTVSTLNYVANQTIANAAVAALGTGGGITVIAGVSGTDLILDTNGYYDGSGSLQLSLSRRAALDQFWTPQNATVLGLTTVGTRPELLKFDGADIWVANNLGNSVSRVRASDGKLLETWTGATSAAGVLVAMGRILVTGATSPGSLYMIDPSQPAGPVTTVTSNLGNGPFGITFDGARVWTANEFGSVSIVTPGATTPWTVTTVTTGFTNLFGALYDGANVWVTDFSAGTLLKLDSAGAILQTVTVGSSRFPVFDGTNIWVPNFSNSVSVVRASNGVVLQTLTGNGLNVPVAAAFDGQRVLITNETGNSVSLWKAADLTALGSFATGSNTTPFGVCSDGGNFWITLLNAGKLARF